MLLKPAYSRSKLPVPMGWHEMACGETVRQQTQHQLDGFSRRVRVGSTVMLGPLAQGLDGSSMAIKAPLILSPVGQGMNVRCELSHLSIKNNVLDNIVMPFVLEFCRDPHQVLREMNRTLADDGHLLLMGFNPISPALWGGWRPGQKKDFPWAGRYFSAVRVKDWLALLGYQIVDTQYYVDQFLMNDRASSRWVSGLCRRVPHMHAAYSILARKCVYQPIAKMPRQRTNALKQRPIAAARIHTSLKQK